MPSSALTGAVGALDRVRQREEGAVEQRGGVDGEQRARRYRPAAAADSVRAMLTLTGLDELKAQVGEELGVSRWHEVTQEAIDDFADVTGDDQWIHVDPERAKDTPFGGTIAHGYYTLSLAPEFSYEIVLARGLRVRDQLRPQRVRFPAPLPVGVEVRMRAKLAERRGRPRRRADHDRADLRADRQRRREADLVQAVVEREGEALELEDLVVEARAEREREVAVGDRAAERRLLRALDVDVDPLVVAGDVGERVDVLLGDLVPVGGAERLALGGLELVESGDRPHGRAPYFAP